jgi:hypothetical protein
MSEVESITIRRASDADRPELDRLAGLDSRQLPSDDYLIAEVDGEPRAAVGLRTDVLVATPFHATADLAELLRLRARRLRDSAPGRRPTRGLLRRLTAAASVHLPRPAAGGPRPSPGAPGGGAPSSP